MSLSAAFLAGLVSFVSPCVLPLVPPYLAYLAGVTFSELRDDRQIDNAGRRRVIISSLLFVAGFTIVFVAMGATASFIGKALNQYFGILSIVAGTLICVMGLHFLGLFRVSLFNREARYQFKGISTAPIGAFFMGFAFAFGWTPCVGPVLAAILFMAGSEESTIQSMLLLTSYSLGIGLPFVLAAVFSSRFIEWSGRFRLHLGKVEKATGAMLVVTGVLFMTGQMSRIAQWLLDAFPVFANIG